MRVRVLFFARARELAGAGEAAVELEEGATAATLLEVLEAQVRGVVGSGLTLRRCAPASLRRRV